jgi:acetyl esterase/lipase
LIYGPLHAGELMNTCSGLILFFALLLHTGIVAAEDAGTVKRSSDVVYWHKAGMALTMDVFTPPKPNGAGVIFLVSGGWMSSHDEAAPGIVHITPEYYSPYLRRGYTVFAVVHSSMPRFDIPDMVLDLQRAVRFIRHNAGEYGVDPNRLGLLGSSSGGHLALMIATQGSPGPASAPDPIDRESSAVQAVGVFFPPTDFLNYGAPGVDGVGRGPLLVLSAAFGTLADTDVGRQVVGKMISPIYYVTPQLPPTLIIHGDADVVVPLQQSQSFAAKAKEVGAPPVKLIVRKGKGHGWGDYWKSQEDVEAFADWFDLNLNKAAPK